MKEKDKKSAGSRPRVVLLKDLAPQKTVRGGAGKFVFGERIESSRDEHRSQKQPKDKKS